MIRAYFDLMGGYYELIRGYYKLIGGYYEIMGEYSESMQPYYEIIVVIKESASMHWSLDFYVCYRVNGMF